MASNIFGRFGADSRAARSFYQDLRAQDFAHDVESEAAPNLDEENLREPFQDYDVDPADAFAENDSRISTDSVPQPLNTGIDRAHKVPRNAHIGRDTEGRWFPQDEDADNDVPASLLIEPNEGKVPHSRHRSSRLHAAKQVADPGPSTGRPPSQYDTPSAPRRLYHEDSSLGADQHSPLMPRALSSSGKETALWRWANVTNLDKFMWDVYVYYQGKGFWCIVTYRFLNIV